MPFFTGFSITFGSWRKKYWSVIHRTCWKWACRSGYCLHQIFTLADLKILWRVSLPACVGAKFVFYTIHVFITSLTSWTYPKNPTLGTWSQLPHTLHQLLSISLVKAIIKELLLSFSVSTIVLWFCLPSIIIMYIGSCQIVYFFSFSFDYRILFIKCALL